MSHLLLLLSPTDAPDPEPTDELVGAIAANTFFTSNADSRIEFTVTAIPSAGNIDVQIRRVDNNNNQFVRIHNTSRALSLFERVSGTPTSRTSVAAAVQAGDRVKIVSIGTTYTAYVNDVQIWTWTGASAVTTQLGGLVQTLGTGGGLSNLTAWPAS